MTQPTQTDEVPYFPAQAPAVLADPAASAALLRPVLDDLAGVLATIREQDLGRPTPCPDYDLAALSSHVLGWLDFFGTAFADPARRSTRPDPEAFGATGRSDGDLTAVVRTAAARFDAALSSGVLDGQVVMSQSRMDAPAALGMVLGEYVLHGWDLATALGRPWNPPERAVTVSHEFFAAMIAPEYRGAGGFFGQEVPVPDDAPALDRLLGFAGRDPGWAAPAA